MDDSFELEYADELDALDDSLIDVPPPYEPPKSKRSLQFETPKSKSLRQGAKSNPASVGDDFDVEDDNSGLSSSLSEDENMENDTSFPQNRKRMQDVLDKDEIDGILHSQNLVSSNKRPCLKDVQEQRAENDSDWHIDSVIDQIHQKRSKNSQIVVNESIELGTQQPRLNDADDLERSRVHKRIPKCDFISTRGYDGQMVYMKLWDEEVLEADYASVGPELNANGLLPTPVCILKEQMEEEHIRKALEDVDQLQENIRRQLDDNEKELSMSNIENMDPEEVNVPADMDSDDIGKLTEDMKSLWVEKYAPRKYTELLSDESINRSLLHWLKLWDYVVFGKDVPKPPKKGANPKQDKNKNQNFKGKKWAGEVMDDLDAHHRPQQKIALLCGPPGLGKTTLAHIVARHAGYNVVEMNASDDRSVDVFRNKLESATQMKSVMESDPRPNCMVIDEIDGAPLPAINVLLNMIKKSEADTAAAKKKKKKEDGLLLRPIICVCNDQYVPALRQLRQMALILNFPQTESSRLASRLYEVVKVESLKADLNALLALCERTDNDIRSCLNTLQFVRQKQRELTLRDVQTMSVGQKDTQKSLFSVWYEVFTMPRPKKNRFVSIHDLMEGKQDSAQGSNITPSARFQHILHVSQTAGESERVMQGLYENYLEAKSKDPHLTGLKLASEWLCFVDRNNQYVAQTQDYSIMKFSVFLPVAFHFLYASHTPTRVQFPHSQSDANQKLQKVNNLLSILVSDMSPMARKFNSPRTMVLDLLFLLLEILQPTLRPVNTQLYSSREKEELANVVRIMLAYNMTYQQEKTNDGQYVYALDPNVEEVVKFPGLKQRKQLTYAAKQMIAREIELEKMRRTENARPKPSAPVEEEKSTTTNNPKAPAIPNHLQKLEAKSLAPEKPSVNFFGNFVRTKREKPVSKEETAEPKPDKSKRELLDTIVWFHFKEGFSNAVRRSVKVQDFL